MPQPMLKFVSLGLKMPEKRDRSVRRADFDEIYGNYVPDEAARQASRCSQCGIPFCQIHCPLQNNIPDWLMLAAAGRLEEAYLASSATNNMPEICGRICPHDRLCEGSCVIEGAGHGTVAIGSIEKFITETAFASGWVKPVKPSRELASSVGIVGAGPGGLACAEELRRLGHRVHVYDRYDRIGGLLVYGIPNFKLEKHVVERRAKLLRESGIVFHLGHDVGAGFEELREKHDAVLIAVGAYKGRELAAPGAGLGGVVPALDYLIASNRKGLGDAVPDFDSGRLDARGKKVVVIGGGDTAMDCVRTAVRQGAMSVQCLYRRDRDNMPGSRREVGHAEEEGVEFVWLASPEAVLGNGAVDGVRASRMRLGADDGSGRRTPEPVPGSRFTADADLVIKALGFDPENVPALFGSPDLGLTQAGTLAVDGESMATTLPGVFAAGDIVRGASLVVWAILDGRKAALGIDAYIRSQATAAKPDRQPKRRAA